jgi:SM-20-related protein
MVDAELLRSAGFYVRPSFLPTDLCARLRKTAAQQALHPAGVFRGQELLYDDRVRRVNGVRMREELRSTVESHFAAVMPDIGRDLHYELDGQQSAQLLVYQRGAFFRPHIDNSGDVWLPRDVRDRRVSAIVFLGRQTRLPEPGCYCGGALTFFRLPGVGGAAGVRVDIWGEEGLLIAFPATGTLHEVRPVTHGPRYSLVTWFTGPPPRAAESAPTGVGGPGAR